MTEEGETIRNGMNGTSAANTHSFSYSRSNVDVSQKSTAAAAASEIENTILSTASASGAKSTANGPLPGGRLQFFKGKFYVIIHVDTNASNIWSIFS